MELAFVELVIVKLLSEQTMHGGPDANVIYRHRPIALTSVQGRPWLWHGWRSALPPPRDSARHSLPMARHVPG